jgi:hypothetical protein
MPGPVKPLQTRTLSDQEFNTIRDRLLSEAPDHLSEQDFYNWITPRLSFEVGKLEAQPAPLDGSAMSRFAAGAGEMLNPVSLVKGIGSAVAHPIDTASNIYNASAEQGSKAKDAYQSGHYYEALGHTIGMAPLIGPAAAEAGEQIAQGDIAGGLGKGVGMLIPALGPAGARAAAKGVKAIAPEGIRAAAAGALESSAASKLADVMSPKVGANKVRFGAIAEKIAPNLLKDAENTGWSREGLHGNIRANLGLAEQNLDEAANARSAGHAYPTKPLIDSLLEKRARLTSEAVEGSKVPRAASERVSSVLDARGQPTKVTDLKAEPIGRDVIPAPNRARVAQIDQAISEIKQLGPVARYESLRRIREAYDGPAKARYAPSVTQDFLAKQGEAFGAADVTGSIRESLAKFDGRTADANATYSLYKSADDVMSATAEVERTRPKVGRKIMARLTGTLAGEQMAGAKGAIAGYIFAPVVDAAVSSGMTTQIKTAQLMARLAKAIRAGDEGAVVSASYAIKRLAAQAGTLTGNLTSPNGFRSQTTEPAR